MNDLIVTFMPKPKKTHCIHGHEMTADNVITVTDGRYKWLACKVCKKVSRVKHQNKMKIKRLS